ADSRARAKTGNKIAARIAMMAITTSSSISVNPRSRHVSMEGTLLRSRGTPRVAHPAVRRHCQISCPFGRPRLERPEENAKTRKRENAKKAIRQEGGRGYWTLSRGILQNVRSLSRFRPFAFSRSLRAFLVRIQGEPPGRTS